MTLSETIHTLQDLLQAEQESGPVTGQEALLVHQQRRTSIQQHLAAIERDYRQLRERLQKLPVLPPLSIIRWAQYVQAMPDLVFLELDTTGLYSDAEIIRIVLLDRQGQRLMDRYVTSTTTISPQIAHITGISPAVQREQGVPLATALAELQTHLMGRYLLSYNLDFDRDKLLEATRREGLEEITFLGEDLMPRAMEYFTLTSYPKLDAICRRIGHPLPEHPQQTAIDRACGQQAVLERMAAVTFDAKPDAPVQQVQGDDERPF